MYIGFVVSLFSLVTCSVLPDADILETSNLSVSPVILAGVCLVFLVVLVLVLVSCGGCEDMGGHVSSEDHPACGKQTRTFSTIVGDPNTGVLMSSHTMSETAPMIAPQNLPYSLQPATRQGFTGYQSVPSAPQAQAPATGRHMPASEPPPPSYEQITRQGNLAGYGY